MFFFFLRAEQNQSQTVGETAYFSANTVSVGVNAGRVNRVRLTRFTFGELRQRLAAFPLTASCSFTATSCSQSHAHRHREFWFIPEHRLSIGSEAVLPDLSEAIQSQDVLHGQNAAQVLLYGRLAVGGRLVLAAGGQPGQHLPVLRTVDVLTEPGPDRHQHSVTTV